MGTDQRVFYTAKATGSRDKQRSSCRRACPVRAIRAIDLYLPCLGLSLACAAQMKAVFLRRTYCIVLTLQPAWILSVVALFT